MWSAPADTSISGLRRIRHSLASSKPYNTSFARLLNDSCPFSKWHDGWMHLLNTTKREPVKSQASLGLPIKRFALPCECKKIRSPVQKPASKRGFQRQRSEER